MDLVLTTSKSEVTGSSGPHFRKAELKPDSGPGEVDAKQVLPAALPIVLQAE